MSSSDRDCPSSIVSASEFARRRAFLGSFDPFSFKENLETLFAHLSEAVLLIDAQGRILAANNAACRLFQMTQQELGQQHLPALCQLDPLKPPPLTCTNARAIPLFKSVAQTGS